MLWAIIFSSVNDPECQPDLLVLEEKKIDTEIQKYENELAFMKTKKNLNRNTDVEN